MTQTLLVLAMLTVPTVPVPVEKETPDPKGPPPRIMTASVGADGRANLEVIVTVMVPQQRDREVQVGNRRTLVKQTVYVSVLEQKNISLEGKGVRVFDAAGKPVDAKELPKLIGKKAAVLVSADGKEVDPFYLKLAARSTLVIVMPPAADEPPMPLVPVPAPAPPKE